METHGSIFRRTPLLPLAVTVLPSAETSLWLPPGWRSKSGVQLSLNGKWPSLGLCYVGYTSKKDGYHLTKWQKVEHEQRKHPCLTPQSTIQSQLGLDHAAGCTPPPPESRLVAYRCVGGWKLCRVQGDAQNRPPVSLSHQE